MRRFLLQLLHVAAVQYRRLERRILLLLIGLFALSLGALLVIFYRQNTLLVPATGGTYIEGSVGALQPLIPWFTVQNDVNRDIVSLVFSGLLKYNPQTKKIEEDLATMKISGDAKTYTLTLRNNIYWQDTTTDHPHPVTADDVLFTYQTVQDPAFPNSLLRQNFRGVSIAKVDDRTVQFRLESPYSFFPSNLTLGLLPKASFANIPVDKLDQTLDFGFSHPIGAGPYKVKSIVQTDLSTEVTLERFERTYGPIERLDRVIFRIFPDFPSLLSDLRSLQGLRLASKNDKGVPVVPQQMLGRTYTLPQYVALFFNLDRETLKDQKLRLGLQLGTNKQNIVDAIHESLIVDTPLLELPSADWRYHFDPTAAQGALFESQWYFPEKLRLQHLLEQREASSVGPLKVSTVVLLDTGAALTVTGSLVRVGTGARLNGLEVQVSKTASGSWIVALPTAKSATGSLRIGYNTLRLTDAKGKVLDSAFVWRYNRVEDYQKALAEQKLIDLFLASKDPSVPAEQKITIDNLKLDGGFLRKRTSQDGVDVRVNDKKQQLTLTLLTSPSPPQYKQVADLVAQQWRALGVDVHVEVPAERSAFEERLLKRDYDVLLFGQSLLDNLDSYPYWHSSGVQKVTKNKADLRLDAYNLSQYSSLNADTELEAIRRTSDERERMSSLRRLSDILKRDIPAIPLYSPTYTFAHDKEILGVELGALSLHSDRFLTLDHWYLNQDRIFKPSTGWLDFIPWLFGFFEGNDEPADAQTGSGGALRPATGSGAQ